MKRFFYSFSPSSLFALAVACAIQSASAFASDEVRFIQVKTQNVEERSTVANLGMSIEAVRSDSVWGFANTQEIEAIQKQGFKVLGNYSFETGRGGHEGILDFPSSDSRFHNYTETVAALRDLNSKHADITRITSIGKTIENRDIWALQINTDPEALASSRSTKPGIIYMGNHHAREHLSLEIPLMFAQYLLEHREDAEISRLLETRDIWFVPMVNPDGVEWDISTGRYKNWRKNRRNNGNGTFGVDLNRNYGFMWGTGGSSTDTSSDVYMGTQAFSEPETQAIRDFVNNHLNAKILLSFHTFSELILYPWGHKYDGIGNSRDRQTFETMARTMAQWNRYTPQQSSQLYIASGDTTDWAYGTHGIFAFTFELSPKDMWGGGGFYPGAGVIDRVFQDNLRPCLYLLGLADDPHRASSSQPSSFLPNYVQPGSDAWILGSSPLVSSVQ